MIIDFLTTCTSLIKVSNYDTASTNLVANNYTVKNTNDIKSWTLSTDSVSSMNFIVMSPDIKILKEIVFDLVGSDQVQIKIETSLDRINWVELPYKRFKSVETPNITYLYKVFNVATSGATVQYFNIDLEEFGLYVDNNEENLEYEFKKVNKYNEEEEYLYDNLEWKFIKISLSNIPVSATPNTMFFSNLQIFVDEENTTDLGNINFLELKSQMFTQSKIYEDYPFIPDTIKNYMKMLEEKNNIMDTLRFSNVYVNFVPEIPGTTLEGIGNDIIGVDTVIYE